MPQPHKGLAFARPVFGLWFGAQPSRQPGGAQQTRIPSASGL